MQKNLSSTSMLCTVSSFPPEMKQSSEPNLDILGVPICTADLCSVFIFQKHVTVKQLLNFCPVWKRLEQLILTLPNFRLPLSGGLACRLCPEIALDPLGHHAVTCKEGGNVVSRHNKLCDVFSASSFGCPGGNGYNLTNHSHIGPADNLVSNWVLGKPAAFDFVCHIST